MSRRIGFLHAAAVVNHENDGSPELFRVQGWALAIEGDRYVQSYTDGRSLMEALAMRSEPLRLFACGDREVVQLLADGVRGVKFGAVRGGTVIACSFLQGHVVIQNAASLFGGVTLKELVEVAGPTVLSDPEEVAINGLKAILILSETLERITGTPAVGGTRRTAAGLALCALERIAGRLPVHLEHGEAHRGGRCEAYQVGVERGAVHYDVNSSYPAAFVDAPEQDVLLHVKVKVKARTWLPPFFHAPGVKLYFPTGSVETWVMASNLERYIEPHNKGEWRIERVLERVPFGMGWIKRVAPFMAEVYRERMEAKKRGDLTGAVARKAILVGAYGKMGTSGTVELAGLRARPPRDGIYYRLEEQQYLSFREVKKVDAKRRANFLFASWITDNGRARLFDALSRTVPIYCDTDAVYAGSGEPGAVGSGLGEWKIEGTGTMLVRNTKDYRFNEITKRKGGEFQRAATLKAWAKNGRIVTVERNRRTAYDKRTVLEDGSTIPIHIT